MCGIAEATIASAVIGTVTSGVGAYQQSEASSAQAKYAQAQADLERQANLENARRARENADKAIQAQRDLVSEGDQARANQAEQVESLVQDQRAAAARNGVSGDSVDNIINDTYRRGDSDRRAMQRDINRQFAGLGQQAEDFQLQAENFRRGAASAALQSSMYGAAADQSPWLGIASDSLLAGSQILGNYGDMKAAGMFSKKGSAPSNRVIRNQMLLGPR